MFNLRIISHVTQFVPPTLTFGAQIPTTNTKFIFTINLTHTVHVVAEDFLGLVVLRRVHVFAAINSQCLWIPGTGRLCRELKTVRL